MNKTIDEELAGNVLSTWFKDDNTGQMDLPQKKRWFMGGKKLDDMLSQQFGQAVQNAQAGHLDHWQGHTYSALALIVLLDQFSRNIHRGTALAFAGDAKALAVSKSMISTGKHELLPLTQKVFLYLPFEHDESEASQQISIRLFTALRDEAEPSLSGFAQATLDSAIEHDAIIKQFGRYPHRNNTLGRTSTAEELAWLGEKGKSFGQ